MTPLNLMASSFFSKTELPFYYKQITVIGQSDLRVSCSFFPLLKYLAIYKVFYISSVLTMEIIFFMKIRVSNQLP